MCVNRHTHSNTPTRKREKSRPIHHHHQELESVLRFLCTFSVCVYRSLAHSHAPNTCICTVQSRVLNWWKKCSAHFYIERGGFRVNEIGKKILVTTAIVRVSVFEWMYFFVLQVLRSLARCVCACAMVGRGWWAEKIGFWNVGCARVDERREKNVSALVDLLSLVRYRSSNICRWSSPLCPLLPVAVRVWFGSFFSAFLFSAIYFHVHGGTWNIAAGCCCCRHFLCFSRRFLRTHWVERKKWKGLHIKTHTNSLNGFFWHSHKFAIKKSLYIDSKSERVRATERGTIDRDCTWNSTRYF